MLICKIADLPNNEPPTFFHFRSSFVYFVFFVAESKFKFILILATVLLDN